MTKKEERFVQTVWEYYLAHGRSNLPWRKTQSPYRILVSEIMCQQTQVDRVVPKYKAFLKAFPTVRALADAPLGDVLRAWQGLGYNRRAKMLHRAASAVSRQCGGTFPKTYEELLALPGVGPYTAGAIMAFAYDKATVMIETNIRSAYLHFFFKDAEGVSDAELLTLIEKTADAKRPREWYSALMDYGAHIKKIHGNPNARSKHYTKQSKFVGSDRQIRGAIIRALTAEPQTRKQLHKLCDAEDIRVDAQIERLLEEGMIQKRGAKYML